MPLPEIAAQISGKTYHFSAPGWPKEVTFNFSGNETYTNAILMANGEFVTITGGLNNVFFLNMLGPEQKTIMAWKGHWQDEHTFVEEQNFDLTSEAQSYKVTYNFDGNKVFVTVDSSMDLPPLKGIGEIIE